MKTLSINGNTFEYELEAHSGEFSDYYTTNFYQGTETITRKKFWLFGKKITKTIPKLVFTLNMDIEDPSYTKSEIRASIKRKIELMGRLAEIERGEII